MSPRKGLFSALHAAWLKASVLERNLPSQPASARNGRPLLEGELQPHEKCPAMMVAYLRLPSVFDQTVRYDSDADAVRTEQSQPCENAISKQTLVPHSATNGFGLCTPEAETHYFTSSTSEYQVRLDFESCRTQRKLAPSSCAILASRDNLASLKCSTELSPSYRGKGLVQGLRHKIHPGPATCSAAF